MTVSQVIDFLQRLDPDLPVMSVDAEPVDYVFESDYDDETGTHRFVAVEFGEANSGD